MYIRTPIPSLGRMSAAERARGRYMRAPDGHQSVAELARETKAAFTDQFNGLDARLAVIEQKSARRGGVEQPQGESLGQAFVAAEGLASFAANRERPGRLQVETKAITSVANSAAALSLQPFRDQPVNIPQTKLSVRSLIPTIPISTGTVEVPYQTSRSNNAGMVAEGTLKPQSDYTWELRSLQVRKIAHWVLASSEILADAPQLQATIDAELVYGVAYVEDKQLLLGDGTGQNLLGLIPNATAAVDPLVLASPNYIDQIGTALLQSALADFPADGIVLHSSDWMRMRLLKNAQGEYLLGDPGSAAPPVLFGKPVVETKAIPVGTYLTGQFAVASTIYDRMNTVVLVSTEDGDNFRRNMCTILAEERLAHAVKQPKALVTGQFK